IPLDTEQRPATSQPPSNKNVPLSNAPRRRKPPVAISTSIKIPKRSEGSSQALGQAHPRGKMHIGRKIEIAVELYAHHASVLV
ncbi:UNVERIFIED_CONTAM: hypothetical protein Sindi_2694500, partial [Sesamum indicum]